MFEFLPALCWHFYYDDYLAFIFFYSFKVFFSHFLNISFLLPGEGAYKLVDVQNVDKHTWATIIAMK